MTTVTRDSKRRAHNSPRSRCCGRQRKLPQPSTPSLQKPHANERCARGGSEKRVGRTAR